MQSVNGANSVIRRYSEPLRFNYPPMKQTMETFGELASGRLKETALAAVNANHIANSSSRSFATPKNLGQRYTSTVSLNISTTNTSPSSMKTDTASTAIRSPKTNLTESSDSQGEKDTMALRSFIMFVKSFFFYFFLKSGITQSTSPATFNERISIVPHPSNSFLRQNTSQSTLTTSPLHRSQSEKYTSPLSTDFNDRFSSHLKTADEINGTVISTSRMTGGPVFAQEEDDLADQKSDIDKETSGEYEKEEIVVMEKGKEPTEKKARNGSPVEAPKIVRLVFRERTANVIS